MKNIKISLIALILISGMLINTGCPGIGTEPAISFLILLDRDIKDGKIEVNKKNAAEGDTVRITTSPDSGYEAVEVKVRDSLNHSESVVRVTNNVWTFKMPASNVTINATFLTTGETLQKAVGRLTLSSTWDEFNEANTLIKKLQGLPGDALDKASEDILESAINKLAGKEGNAGLVLEKIRIENMTDGWVTGLLASSPEFRNVLDITDCTCPGGQEARYLTKIFYVKSQISGGERPQVKAMDGWEIEGTEECITNANRNLDHVRLSYRVGTKVNNTVRYNLLLCQTAQFNVTYENAAKGNVYIISFDPSRNLVIKHNFINETLGREWFSEVGPAVASLDDESMYTVVYATSSDIQITVTVGSNPIPVEPVYLPIGASTLGSSTFVPPLWDPLERKFENRRGAKFYPASVVYNVRVSG